MFDLLWGWDRRPVSGHKMNMPYPGTRQACAQSVCCLQPKLLRLALSIRSNLQGP